MNRNLKQAFFSALLVWAVAFPVLGLKLSIDGISLVVHSQGSFTISIIAVCSVLMFLRVLFDKQWSSVMGRRSDRKLIPRQSATTSPCPRPSATSSSG